MPCRLIDGKCVEHKSTFFVPEHQTEIQALTRNQIPILKFDSNRCLHRDLAETSMRRPRYAGPMQTKTVIPGGGIAIRPVVFEMCGR